VKLHAPFIQLPLLFDADALAREVLAIDESRWMPHPQGFAGNSMLPLVAVDGDPANETFIGPMLPTPYLRASPYLAQVFASLGATIGRSRLMRLSGQAEVSRHFDQGYYWADRVRVHVPVVTQPTVRFECGDTAINMAAGECWIFDTWRMHRVLNDADAARIHLVVDTVGGSGFSDLVGRGRMPGTSPREGWQPRHVAPAPGADARFPLESVNVPMVMNPWEMHVHFGQLFGDALPHPQLRRVQLLAAQLIRGWRGLWAQYGERPEGHAHYRVLIDRFKQEALPLSEPLLLSNGGALRTAMILMILQSTVNDGAGQAAGEYGSSDRG